MISFQGSYIKSLNIRSKSSNGKFEPSCASLVKLNPENAGDIRSLGLAVQNWENSEKYGAGIVQNMCDIFNFGLKDGMSEIPDFYIATSQMNNFDSLEPQKILGVMQTIEKPNSNIRRVIELFEVNPEYKFSNIGRRLKDIGHSMIDFMKMNFPADNIGVKPAHNAIRFYLKEGFEFISPVGDFLILKRKR